MDVTWQNVLFGLIWEFSGHHGHHVELTPFISLPSSQRCSYGCDERGYPENFHVWPKIFISTFPEFMKLANTSKWHCLFIWGRNVMLQKHCSVKLNVIRPHYYVGANFIDLDVHLTFQDGFKAFPIIKCTFKSLMIRWIMLLCFFRVLSNCLYRNIPLWNSYMIVSRRDALIDNFVASTVWST